MHTHKWQVITEEMKATIAALREKVTVGLVGGSDFVKVNEQMDGQGQLPRTLGLG